MASKQCGFTRDYFQERYPALVKVIDNIFEKNKTKYSAQRVNFSGRYKDKRISLTKIIEIIEENGFEVNMSVKPKLTK